MRTWNKRSPYPEEANRQLIDVLADLYFAPTLQSKENLLAENHDPEAIFVTGNTAIDAMRYTVSQDYQHPTLTDRKQRKILLTMHRRENLGQPMKNVFQALARIAGEFPEVSVVFPMHKNPKVREIAQETLGALENVSLIEPLDVIDFHNFANQSTLILTDSGGVQEEAPSLGVPVLVLRDTTERPEGIAAGTLKLVGTGKRMCIKQRSSCCRITLHIPQWRMLKILMVMVKQVSESKKCWLNITVCPEWQILRSNDPKLKMELKNNKSIFT